MLSTTQMQRTTPVQAPSKSEPSTRTSVEGQEPSAPATRGAWDGVARQGHRFDALPVTSKPAPPSSSQPIQAKWKSGFKPGDKVFGTSNGSGYNVAAQNIRDAGLASESSDVNMGAMIQYIKDPKDPENEPPTHPDAAAEWNAFKEHHAEWVSKKPSRQKKTGFKPISKAGVDFTTRKMGKNIHFVPGNLDWAQAADKSTKEGKRTTAHELRYIYRNWDEMKNQVQFYSDAEGTPASAPWEHPDTKASWDAYADRRAQKKKQ